MALRSVVPAVDRGGELVMPFHFNCIGMWRDAPSKARPIF